MAKTAALKRIKHSRGDDARVTRRSRRQRRPTAEDVAPAEIEPTGHTYLGSNSISDEQQEIQRNRLVRIHIDQHRYESPNPTTGEALYLLGKVASGSDLYREVEGNREDQPVWDDGEEIHLHEDEHFHSGPAATITG